MTSDDRRYLVINSNRDRPSAEYFKALVPWVENNLDVILYYLENLDLSSFNPNQAPPMTAGKQLMIDLTTDPVKEHLAGMIEDGKTPFKHDLFKLDDVLRTLRNSGEFDKGLTRPKLQRVFAELGVIKLGQKGTQINGEAVRATLWVCRDQKRYQAMGDRELMEIFLNQSKESQGEIPF